MASTEAVTGAHAPADHADDRGRSQDPQRPRRRRWARVALVTLAVTLALVLLVVAAWAADRRAAEGEVLRGTSLAGVAIGGLDRAELADAVEAVSNRYAQSEVRVRTPEGAFTATAGEVGLGVDPEATVAAALQAGRDRPLVEQPVDWLLSFTRDRRAPVLVEVDPVSVAQVVADRDPTGRVAPTQPTIAGRPDGVAAVPGEDGRGLAPEEVAAAIRRAARSGELPISVREEATSLPPSVPLEAAERLARHVEAVTADGLPVIAGSTEAEVPPDVQRSWLGATPTPDATDLVLDLDDEQVVTDLAELLPDAGDDPRDATFSVRGGSVVIEPAQPGTACCAPEAAAEVQEALATGRDEGDPVDLPLREVQADRTTEDARALGITREVASFTTGHAAGEARVTNIHRIADLTRGVVIEPGATFSVNDHVGRRTRAKGFVSAGVIYNGEFTDDVGGGISQYATTLFNAAFFAGLDLVEYQSHSIYISRYPYGREATLSYPKPDLRIRNNTPHGILLWPTYTDSSITVSLYSTPYVSGEQTGQRRAPAGACTRVTTERTRTWVDGRRQVDAVIALYRPAEGVHCR